MADDDVAPTAALPVTTVQAWRARVDAATGDVVVLELGVEGGALPPLLVPVASVAGLAAVLLQAAAIDLESGSDLGWVADLPAGSPWPALLAAERVGADALERANLPGAPGAYAWFRRGVPVHLGRAVGKRGLRARIGGDALRGEADRLRSPFRAAVADHLGLDPAPDGDPTRLAPDQVAAVDGWIAGCEVAWLAAASPAEASRLEAALRAGHDPTFDASA